MEIASTDTLKVYRNYKFNENTANIISEFKSVVKKYPSEIAVTFDGKDSTYYEVDKISDHIACGIISKGIQRDSIIAIYMDKSDIFLFLILGVLKAGCSYLPITKVYPLDRIKEIIDISGACTVIINDDNLLEEMIQNISYDELMNTSWNDSLLKNMVYNPLSIAYIFFTSGSTGKPNGVAIRRNSLVNIAYSIHYDVLNMKKNERCTVGIFAPFVFDVSVGAIFSTLLNGNKLSIMNDITKISVDKVFDYIEKEQINVIDLTPTYIDIIVQWYRFSNRNIRWPKKIISAGEALPLQLLKRLYEIPGTENMTVSNAYGPTETCVYATVKVFNKEVAEKYLRMTVGTPLTNYEVYVLDEKGQLCNENTYGEICISGVGVGVGYINRKDLTDSTFVKNCVTNTGLMYRTGDIGQIDASGEIICIGRKDDQVKINGYRISLGDIEKNIENLDCILHCKVMVKQRGNNKILVAYFKSLREVELEELYISLDKLVPKYMIPAYFVPVKEFFMDINGKLDKKKLPDYHVYALKTSYLIDEIYEDIYSQELLQLVSEILLREDICLRDNFFRIGGASLHIHILAMKIWKKWNIELDISVLYQCNNLQEIVNILKAKKNYINNENKIIKGYIKALLPQQYIFTNKSIADLRESRDDTYDMIMKIQCSEYLEAHRLEIALIKLCDNQDILKSEFKLQDENWYFKIKNHIKTPLLYVKLKGKICDDSILKFIEKLDVTTAPLFQFILFENENKEQVILFHVHHAIFDFFSLQVFIEQLFDFYDGVPVLSLNINYVNYVKFKYPIMRRQQLPFWKSYLKDRPRVVSFHNVPYDDKNENGHSGITNKIGTIVSEISKNQKELIKDYCKISSTTPFIFMISILALLMNEKTKQNEFMIGINVNGRNSSEDINRIGMLTNQECLRFHLVDNITLDQVINITKSNYVEVMKNQMIALGDIYNCQSEEESRKGEIFHVFFNYLSLESVDVIRNNREVKVDELDINADFAPMVWTVMDYKERTDVHITYYQEIYEEDYVKTIIEDYISLINKLLNEKN